MHASASGGGLNSADMRQNLTAYASKLDRLDHCELATALLGAYHRTVTVTCDIDRSVTWRRMGVRIADRKRHDEVDWRGGERASGVCQTSERLIAAPRTIRFLFVSQQPPLSLLSRFVAMSYRSAEDEWSGVELPKNGIHHASTTGSTAGRFESMLDELYLCQGYRNSHHTRVASAASSGSSLVNGSLSSLRFLSATCYRSLKDLFLQEDPTLEAIFLQYRDVGGAANPAAYADFLHSLITLSQRWKRYIFFRDDPRDYLRQSRALFAILEDYLAQKLITYGEYDFLENVLYNLSAGASGETVDDGSGVQSEENGFLLAAWAVMWEAINTGGDQNLAVMEFYDSILHLLENQIQLIYRRYTSEATNFLLQLNSNYNYKFAGATLKHLMSLIHQQARYEDRKRRGDHTPLTPAEEEGEKQSTLLFACMAESASSQNVHELIDSLRLIGNSWRKSSPHINLLQCLRYIEAHGLLSTAECDQAELLVYERDAFVLASWAIYEEADYSKRAFDDFIDSIRVALEKEFRESMARLAREGYKLVNSWSVRPDARPRLHDDPLRDEVLGLQRVRADTSEFVLPETVRGTLGVAESSVVRSLLSERDPVLLALLAEYADTGDLAELLDGVERRVAKEQYGSAAARRRQMRATGCGSSEQALDIYQLSQMLLSLQQDGYLSHDTLLQLLYAVQERADPVLLAAFAMYKEGLLAGGPDGWPEMWDTLQRVWQRIQRDNAQLDEARHFEARGATSFLSTQDAVLLRHVGTELLDAISESLSITNTLYLRDLLRTGDVTLYAILSLAQDGEVNDEAEVQQSLIILGQRWVKELEREGQLMVQVLTSLAHSKVSSTHRLRAKRSARCLSYSIVLSICCVLLSR
jgi:hypothetical protein